MAEKVFKNNPGLCHVILFFCFRFAAQMLPKFAQKLSDAEANEGKQCILKCKIDCIPPPKVQWFKGGSEITKDPRVKVSIDWHKFKLVHTALSGY